MNSSLIGGFILTDFLSEAIEISSLSPTFSPTLINFGCPTNWSLMNAFCTAP